MNKSKLINRRTFKRALKNKKFMTWAFGSDLPYIVIGQSIQYWVANHSDLYAPQKGETIRSVLSKIYNIYKKSVVRKFRTTQ